LLQDCLGLVAEATVRFTPECHPNWRTVPATDQAT
jgi:hypothetical protein